MPYGVWLLEVSMGHVIPRPSRLEGIPKDLLSCKEVSMGHVIPRPSRRRRQLPSNVVKPESFNGPRDSSPFATLINGFVHVGNVEVFQWAT